MITVTTNLENCKKNDWTKKTHKYQAKGKRQKAKGKRHKAQGKWQYTRKGQFENRKMKLLRKG